MTTTLPSYRGINPNAIRKQTKYAVTTWVKAAAMTACKNMLDAHSDSQMRLSDTVEFVRIVVAASATKADNHLVVALVRENLDV